MGVRTMSHHGFNPCNTSRSSYDKSITAPSPYPKSLPLPLPTEWQDPAHCNPIQTADFEGRLHQLDEDDRLRDREHFRDAP